MSPDRTVRRDGVEWSLPRLTPAELAPALKIPADLAAAVVTELDAACTEEEALEGLDLKYGLSTAKLIRAMTGSLTAHTPAGIPRAIGQAMLETLQSQPPTKTALGRVIHDYSIEMIEMARGVQRFFEAVPGRTDQYAVAAAARIRDDLPEYHRAVGIILQQAAEGLRKHALSKGFEKIRMFRGLHGDAAPQTVAEAGPDAFAMQPLASWSMMEDDAAHFASMGNRGVLIEAMVPIGCLAISPSVKEAEVMVFPVSITVRHPSASHHELEIISVHHIPRA